MQFAVADLYTVVCTQQNKTNLFGGFMLYQAELSAHSDSAVLFHHVLNPNNILNPNNTPELMVLVSTFRAKGTAISAML